MLATNSDRCEPQRERALFIRAVPHGDDGGRYTGLLLQLGGKDGAPIVSLHPVGAEVYRDPSFHYLLGWRGEAPSSLSPPHVSTDT